MTFSIELGYHNLRFECKDGRYYWTLDDHDGSWEEITADVFKAAKLMADGYDQMSKGVSLR